MKSLAVLCCSVLVSFPAALAQPPDPPDPATITVCPKFYWGEWGGIHYYTASTCTITMMGCTEGEETQAQSFRIHTTQPTCCPSCADPIFGTVVLVFARPSNVSCSRPAIHLRSRTRARGRNAQRRN